MGSFEAKQGDALSAFLVSFDGGVNDDIVSGEILKRWSSYRLSSLFLKRRTIFPILCFYLWVKLFLSNFVPMHVYLITDL